MPTTRNVILGLALCLALIALLNGWTRRVAAQDAPQPCALADRYLVYDVGLRARLALWSSGIQTTVDLPEIDARGVCVPEQERGALASAGVPYAPDPVVSLPEPSFVADGLIVQAPPAEVWNVARMRAPEAWPLSRGEGVTIAIIDTGVDCRHEAFAGRCLEGVDVIGGRPQGPGLPGDGHGHGTHTAGTAAGAGVGIAPAARIRPCRALDDSGFGSDSGVARCILDMAAPGAILSMSLGGTEQSTAMRDAIGVATSRGAIVVAARGNAGGTGRSYPACYEPVVGVLASDEQDRRAYFSDFGPCSDVAAPGVSVPSAWPGGAYRSLSGTSMSTPGVSGVLALLVALGDRDPVGTLLATMDAAQDSTLPGIANAYAAVTRAQPGATVTAGPTATDGPTRTPAPPLPTWPPTVDPYPGPTGTPLHPTATPTRTPTRAAPTPTAPRPVQCEDLGLCEGRGGLLGTRRLCGPCGG